MKNTLSTALLLSALGSFSPAQTLDAFVGVDFGAKTTTIELKVTGAPGATVGLLASFKLASTPTTFWFGTVYLDLASLVQIGTITLNGVGVGSLSFTLPAAVFKSYAFDVQAAVLSGTTLSLTKYAMIGGSATTTSSEILVSTYHPTDDNFYVVGKGPSGALMELFRQPPLALRLRLGGITVPFAMMAWGFKPCMFTPGDALQVYTFGTSKTIEMR